MFRRLATAEIALSLLSLMKDPGLIVSIKINTTRVNIKRNRNAKITFPPLPAIVLFRVCYIKDHKC